MKPLCLIFMLGLSFSASNLSAQFENKPLKLEDFNYYAELSGTPLQIIERKFLPFHPAKGDTLFEVTPVEFIFENGFLIKNVRRGNHDLYEMVSTLDTIQDEILLTRTDSFYHGDPSNVTGYENTYGKPINHKDTVIYLFSLNRKLLEENRLSYGRIEYGFNENGDPSFKKLFEKNKLTGIFTWLYKYDENGKMSECMEFRDLTLSAHMVITYRENLEIQNYIRYHENDVEYVQTTYNFYHSSGRLYRKIDVGKSNYYVYEYNSRGDETNNFSASNIGISRKSLGRDARSNNNWMIYSMMHQYQYDKNENWVIKNTVILQNNDKKFQFYSAENRQIEY